MDGTGHDYGAFAPTVRAGDADRESTVELLREHHAEGRIDVTEFQERLDRAYQAKTLGELRELASDLPHSAAYLRELDGSPRLRARWMLPWIPILFAAIAVSALLGHHHRGIWLLIPLFFLVRYLRSGAAPWARRRRHSPYL